MNEPRHGELRSRIRLCSWTDTPNMSGGVDEKLERIISVWAKVEVVSAQMWWGSAQVGESITHRFWIRCVDGLTDSRHLTGRTKVLYEGSEFRIRRVTDFGERHVWTIIEAEELGQSDG